MLRPSTDWDIHDRKNNKKNNINNNTSVSVRWAMILPMYEPMLELIWGLIAIGWLELGDLYSEEESVATDQISSDENDKEGDDSEEEDSPLPRDHSYLPSSHPLMVEDSNHLHKRPCLDLTTKIESPFVELAILELNGVVLFPGSTYSSETSRSFLDSIFGSPNWSLSQRPTHSTWSPFGHSHLWATRTSAQWENDWSFSKCIRRMNDYASSMRGSRNFPFEKAIFAELLVRPSLPE